MDSSTYNLIRGRLAEHISSSSYSKLAIYVVATIWLISLLNTKASPRVAGAKVVGYKAWWEPAFSLKVRFFFDSLNIMSNGYKEFKDKPFVVRRYDTDISILPMKYLEEIRLFPRHKLNRTTSLVNLHAPRWTGVGFMLRSNLLDRVLMDRLTPNLNKYLTVVQKEFEYVWDPIMPRCEDWTSVDIQHHLCHVVAGMASSIFVGYPACRDPEWLNIAVKFTEDFFLTSFTLRMFPDWIQPIIAPIVPVRWRLLQHYKGSEKITKELMRAHREAKENGEEPQDTLLGWMVDKGTEEEVQVEEMAVRQCVLTLASIHTTSMAVSTALFRLCSHPEWTPILREEVEEVVRDYGYGGNDKITPKEWASKLEKMDSFIVETQRHDPPLCTGPIRTALTDVAFKDGTKIPAGASIACPSYHYSMDPNVMPDPEAFDPLRSYRKRYANDGENHHKFIAGQTNDTQLSFGHGGQACPGRYFAVHEVKLILARILMEYDFAWPEGKTKAKSFYVNELNVVEPSAKIMMKRRKVAA